MFSTLNEQMDALTDSNYIELSEKELYSPLEALAELLEGVDPYHDMYESDGAMRTGVDMPTSEAELKHLDASKYGSPGAEIFSIFNKDYTGLGNDAEEHYDVDQNLEGSFEVDNGSGLNEHNVFAYILGETATEVETMDAMHDFSLELEDVPSSAVDATGHDHEE